MLNRTFTGRDEVRLGGFTLPPLPGETIPEAEDYPTDLDAAEMIASGGLVSAAVLFGLKSFSGTGDLFGPIGQALANPAEALNNLLAYSHALLSSGDPGAREMAEGAMAKGALSRGAALPASRRADELSALSRSLVKEYDAKRKVQASRTEGITHARILGSISRLDDEAPDRDSGFMSKNRYKKRNILDNDIDEYWNMQNLRSAWDIYQRDQPASLRINKPRGQMSDRELLNYAQSNRKFRAVYHNLFNPAGRYEIHIGKNKVDNPTGITPFYNAGLRNYTSMFDEIMSDSILGPGVRFGSLYDHDASISRYGGGLKGAGAKSKSLIDDLGHLTAERFKDLGEAYATAAGIDPSGVDFGIEKIEIAPGRHYLRLFGDAQGLSGEAFLPLPGADGLHLSPNGGRVFAVNNTQFLPNDIFGADPIVSRWKHHRTRPIMSGAESALVRIATMFQKQRNDIVGSKDPARMFDYINRIIKEEMITRSVDAGSSTEMATKASLIEHQETRVMERYLNNQTYKHQINDGLETINRIRRVFETGQRYFAVDSEFVSADILKEIGIKPNLKGASGRVAYEIGGSIMQAGPDGAAYEIGAIDYKADIFNMDVGSMSDLEKSMHAKVKEGIERFQGGNVGRTKSEVSKLINQLRTGHLAVTWEGTEYTLERNELKSKTGKTLHWMPKKEAGEKLESYYARVQNTLLEHSKTKFSAGHNHISSDLALINHISNVHGVLPHTALNPENALDTLPTTQVLAPNRLSSASLGNLTAQMFGMDESQYLDALNSIQKELKGLSASARKSKLVSMASRGGHTEQFYKKLSTIADQLPKEVSY